MSDASNFPADHSSVDAPPSVPDELDQADETIALSADELEEASDEDVEAAPDAFPSPDVV